MCYHVSMSNMSNTFKDKLYGDEFYAQRKSLLPHSFVVAATMTDFKPLLMCYVRLWLLAWYWNIWAPHSNGISCSRNAIGYEFLTMLLSNLQTFKPHKSITKWHFVVNTTSCYDKTCRHKQRLIYLLTYFIL